MRRLPTPKPDCKGWATWLKASGRVTKHELGAFGGTDVRALEASLHVIRLWGGGDDAHRRAACIALRALVDSMQPHCRRFVKFLIPMVLDWDHEEQLWREAGLMVPLEQREGADAAAERRERDEDPGRTLKRLEAMGFRPVKA